MFDIAIEGPQEVAVLMLLMVVMVMMVMMVIMVMMVMMSPQIQGNTS
jgi:hypothetical protein